MTVVVEMAGVQVHDGSLRPNSPTFLLQNAVVETIHHQRGVKRVHPRSLQKPLELNTLLAMEGGEGDASYAKNSRTQADGLKSVQSILDAAIHRMSLPKKDLLRIADLGCSSGPNSIDHMNLVVSTLKKRYEERGEKKRKKCDDEHRRRDWEGCQGDAIPEFHVFFADLLSNDFNSLFRHLGRGTSGGAADYFPSCVAGSFYGRLLPRASVDVVFSSFSLHWMSKIPEAVQQKGSPAHNNGFVWIHGGKSEVGRAYAEQAKRDLCDFLRARAQEMTSGGLMFLLLKGRRDPNPTIQYDPEGCTMFGKHLEEVFNELISEGSLDEEVRDSFNLPIYYRTVDEMREAIEEVDEFVIDRLELLQDVPGNPSTPQELQTNPVDCGRRVAKICRSLLGVLVETHMGIEVADEFFRRLERRAIARSEAEALKQRVAFSDVNLAVLFRK